MPIFKNLYSENMGPGGIEPPSLGLSVKNAGAENSSL